MPLFLRQPAPLAAIQTYGSKMQKQGRRTLRCDGPGMTLFCG